MTLILSACLCAYVLAGVLVTYFSPGPNQVILFYRISDDVPTKGKIFVFGYLAGIVIIWPLYLLLSKLN